MAPGALARLLARKRFTSKKADLPMVVELNTRTILALFADAEELGYAKLGWRDADLVQLCEVLPLCSALRRLMLYENVLTEAGLQAFAKVCASGAMAKLKKLDLEKNQIGDVGCTALADACATGALAQLEILNLHGNQIGDAGVSALASACATGAFAKLETLELWGNNIDDIGVTALASACDTGALASLSELEMGNGPMGADHPKLKAACKKRGIDLC